MRRLMLVGFAALAAAGLPVMGHSQGRQTNPFDQMLGEEPQPPISFEKPPCATPQDLVRLEQMRLAWEKAYNALRDANAARNLATRDLEQANLAAAQARVALSQAMLRYAQLKSAQTQADVDKADANLLKAETDLQAAWARSDRAFQAFWDAVDDYRTRERQFKNELRAQFARKCPPHEPGVTPPPKDEAPKPPPKPNPPGGAGGGAGTGAGGTGGGTGSGAAPPPSDGPKPTSVGVDEPPTSFEKPPCATAEDLKGLEDLLKLWEEWYVHTRDAVAAVNLASSELKQAKDAEDKAVAEFVRIGSLPYGQRTGLDQAIANMKKASDARQAASERYEKAFWTYQADKAFDQFVQGDFEKKLQQLNGQKCPAPEPHDVPSPAREPPELPPREPAPAPTPGYNPLACYPTPLEAGVLTAIDGLRADPAGFTPSLTLAYGAPARDETAGFLATARPAPPVNCDGRLEQAAHRHLADVGPKGGLGHTGSDGSSPGKRMYDAGVNAQIYAEEISASFTSPGGVVSQFLIDAPGPRHPHRMDIMSPDLTDAGVACGPNAQWKIMCVVDMTSAPLGRSTPPPPP